MQTFGFRCFNKWCHLFSIMVRQRLHYIESIRKKPQSWSCHLIRWIDTHIHKYVGNTNHVVIIFDYDLISNMRANYNNLHYNDRDKKSEISFWIFLALRASYFWNQTSEQNYFSFRRVLRCDAWKFTIISVSSSRLHVRPFRARRFSFLFKFARNVARLIYSEIRSRGEVAESSTTRTAGPSIYSIRNIPSSHGNLAPASGVEANRLYIRDAEKDEVRERISRLNTVSFHGACPVAGITLTPR